MAAENHRRPAVEVVDARGSDQDWASWLRATALGAEPCPSAGSPSVSVVGLGDALGWLARRHGFALDSSAPATAESRTEWASRQICVRDKPESSASHQLLHEIAHVLLHDLGAHPPDASTARCRGLPKIEADSVACVVATWLGLDISSYAWPYVASWAGSDPRAHPDEAVRVTSSRVAGAAVTIISHLEAVLYGRQPRWALDAPDRQQSVPEQQGKVVAQRPGMVAAGRDPRHEAVLALLQVAERFYLGNRERGWARRYLSTRGLDDEAIQRWRIGFAPGGWTTLTNHLRELGYQDELMEAAGLAKVSSRGTLTDHFRDRVMLPIRTEDGVIVGFTGRAHPRAQQGVPKYLNSPETIAYRKGDVLFGLGESRQELASGATPVLVEGPFDAIAVSLAGPQTYAGLAPCGTALTASQVGALARVVDLEQALVLVALDGDRAGRDGAIRAHRLLNTVASNLGVARLPVGRDPADLLRSEGPAALCAILERAEPLAQLVIDVHLNEWEPRLGHAEGRLAALGSVAALIADALPERIVATIKAITCGREIQTIDERLRPVVNAELAQIAALLPVSAACLVARAADRLGADYSDLVAAVVNAKAAPSLTAASFPAAGTRQTARSGRAPPRRRPTAGISSARRRSSSR